MTYPGVSLEDLDPDRRAVEERRLEREQEYGTYEATQDIPWGNVLAFAAGDRVPKSTVEKYGWLDLGLVKRIDGSDPAAPSAEQGLPAASAPARNATKADWVEYAVARREPGVSEADARAAANEKTRDDLVAEHSQEG